MVDLEGLAGALEKALDSAGIPEQSAAAVALARLYARLLDEPAIAGKYRIPLSHLSKVFEHYSSCVRTTPMESKGLEMSEVAITTALAEHSTTSDLGPKLQSTLKELNLVLPVKSAPAPEVPSEQPAQPKSARDELRDRRLAREHGA